jgi:hypothetical protein
VKAIVRRKLSSEKRGIEQRLAGAVRVNEGGPVLSAGNIDYEIAEKTKAIAHGGIGLIQRVVQKVGLAPRIDAALKVLKIHKPYHESDYVLNIAYNALCGGQRLEDIELRRNDRVLLDALGTASLPDPTTEWGSRLQLGAGGEGLNGASRRMRWGASEPDPRDQYVVKLEKRSAGCEQQRSAIEHLPHGFRRKNADFRGAPCAPVDTLQMIAENGSRDFKAGGKAHLERIPFDMRGHRHDERKPGAAVVERRREHDCGAAPCLFVSGLWVERQPDHVTAFGHVSSPTRPRCQPALPSRSRCGGSAE